MDHDIYIDAAVHPCAESSLYQRRPQEEGGNTWLERATAVAGASWLLLAHHSSQVKATLCGTVEEHCRIVDERRSPVRRVSLDGCHLSIWVLVGKLDELSLWAAEI